MSSERRKDLGAGRMAFAAGERFPMPGIAVRSIHLGARDGGGISIMRHPHQAQLPQSARCIRIWPTAECFSTQCAHSSQIHCDCDRACFRVEGRPFAAATKMTAQWIKRIAQGAVLFDCSLRNVANGRFCSDACSGLFDPSQEVRYPAQGSVSSAASPSGSTSTIRTDCVYNPDGALTSVTVQVDQSAPETTYLTWANFTPDAGNAAAGTVGQANGNLIGVGTNQGSGFTTKYGFDRRNRLTAYTESGSSVGYNLLVVLGPSSDTLMYVHFVAAKAWPMSAVGTAFRRSRALANACVGTS